LTAGELQAVFSHEMAHIVRRDNLTAALAHLVACGFWFYPPAWWLERRALRERESACDELVLRGGADAENYLGAILKVCRFTFAPEPGYAAAGGSGLRERMQAILSAQFRRPAPPLLRFAAVAILTVGALSPLGSAFEIVQPAVTVMRSMTAIPQAPQVEKPHAVRNRRQDRAVQQTQIPPHEAQQARDGAFRGAIRNQPRDRAAVQQPQSPQPQAQQPQDGAFRGTIRPIPLDRMQAMQKLLQQVPTNRPRTMSIARPSAATAAIQAGMAQLEAGNPLGAEESFRMAMAREPWNADAITGIVTALIEQGRRDTAFQFLNQRRLALWNEDPAVGLAFAQSLDRVGDWRDAEKAYSMVIALQPKNVTALNNLAFLLSEHGGDLDDAAMYANRAAAIEPDYPEIADTLGSIYIRRGELDPALRAFESLLRTAPEHAEHLALLLASKGRGDAVRERLKIALGENLSPAARDAIQSLLSKLP
jgi:Tfp pilus assembly protein PilF